tara:strand:- start:128 stop:376 length:249 start_codon:yes stop_codon:yes gene_type:complete
MSKSIESSIREIMAIVFKVDVAEITDDLSAVNFERWDSLAHMNLLVALEEEFDIRFPDEMLGDLASVKLVDLLVKEVLADSQ